MNLCIYRMTKSVKLKMSVSLWKEDYYVEGPDSQVNGRFRRQPPRIVPAFLFESKDWNLSANSIGDCIEDVISGLVFEFNWFGQGIDYCMLHLVLKWIEDLSHDFDSLHLRDRRYIAW